MLRSDLHNPLEEQITGSVTKWKSWGQAGESHVLICSPKCWQRTMNATRLQMLGRAEQEAVSTSMFELLKESCG